jgi:hypothetical protein
MFLGYPPDRGLLTLATTFIAPILGVRAYVTRAFVDAGPALAIRITFGAKLAHLMQASCALMPCRRFPE